MNEAKEKTPLNEEQQMESLHDTALTLADAIRLACYANGVKDHDLVECIVGGVFARYSPGAEVSGGSIGVFEPAFIRLKLAAFVETIARVNIADISYYTPGKHHEYPRANTKLVLADGTHLYCEEMPEDIDHVLNLCGVPIHNVKRLKGV